MRGEARDQYQHLMSSNLISNIVKLKLSRLQWRKHYLDLYLEYFKLGNINRRVIPSYKPVLPAYGLGARLVQRTLTRYSLHDQVILISLSSLV